jgi:hypothetical protein
LPKRQFGAFHIQQTVLLGCRIAWSTIQVRAFIPESYLLMKSRMAKF